MTPPPSPSPPPPVAPRRPRLSPQAKSIVAGSVAGMASVVVCHPLDTIRTRLQVSPQRFSGFFHCARETVARESVLALYKGFLPPFFSQAVYKSVIFTTSAALRDDLLPRHCPSLPPAAVALTSGAIAGGLNATLVTPVELVRNRLQVQYDRGASRQYRGALHCVAQVWRREGPGAFWRGLPTTVLRDGLGVACYFLGYDFARRQLPTDPATGAPTTATLLTAGAVGGVSFWAVALPFDTVKSLIQVQSAPDSAGLVATTRRLLREHGPAHLFRGWQAAFSRGIPGAAITFWAFDKTTRYLDEHEDSLDDRA